ncbi:MAG TPA: tail fiber protein [Steroidobacteraceae bacterium]
MAEPFLGEIRLFAGNFAPRGWAFCAGQLLPIAQNTALFSLIGTNYGGDGRTTFQLPNFQGCVAVHQGNGPGLSPYVIGQTGGSATEELTTAQLPTHVHPIGASSSPATTGAPGAGVALAVASANVYGAPVNVAPMASQQVGGGQPHNNAQPYLALSYIIALQGIFPSRN